MIPEKLTLTYISKEYSLLLKGLALLFMVYDGKCKIWLVR